MLNKKEIGKRVRKCREELDIATETLSNLLNIQTQTLYLIEKGERSVTVEKLIILSNIFGVSIDYLLWGKRNNKNKKFKVLKNNITNEEALSCSTYY